NPFKGGHLGNPGSHGLDDLPSPAQGTQPYGQVTGQGHPDRHLIEMLDGSGSDQGGRDDPHYFLGVIPPMPNAEGGGGDQLGALQPLGGPGHVQAAEKQGKHAHETEYKAQQDPFEITSVKQYLKRIGRIMGFQLARLGLQVEIKKYGNADQYGYGDQLGVYRLSKGMNEP